MTKWYRDQLFPVLLAKEEAGGENAYAAMAQIAASVPAGSGGLFTLPYFAGERTPIHDPQAKGMIFGLQPHHTRAHLYRSALEGIGYSIAQHFDLLAENRLPVHKIMAVGGGAKNPFVAADHRRYAEPGDFRPGSNGWRLLWRRHPLRLGLRLL